MHLGREMLPRLRRSTPATGRAMATLAAAPARPALAGMRPTRRRPLAPSPAPAAAAAAVSAWRPLLVRTLADLGKGVDILAPEEGKEQQRTFLLGYDGRGFEVRDINFRGSILAFPNACFLWRARTLEDVTPESLAPVLLVKPPIEIVVVGAGEKLDRPLPKSTVDFLAVNGVAVEMMDTSSACATFNILNQEDRRVVGALLAVDEEEPPSPSSTAAP